MGNRIIKESICESEQIDELDWMEEVFFYRLIVNCDDYGVMDARPKILKAKLMPLKDVSLSAVQGMVDTLVRVGLIRTYTVDGKPYLQLITWGEHQRVRDSRHRYPTPDAADSGDTPQPAAEEEDEKPEGNEPETTRGDSRQVAASCGEPLQTAAECGSRVQPRAGAESESESNPKPNPTRARTRETDPDFARFWTEYPNKVKKPNALNAWNKLKPETETVARIMQGLAKWKKSDQWTRDGGRFIPHPATWLNARQWEDDVRAFNAAPSKILPAQQFSQRTYEHEDEVEELAMQMYADEFDSENGTNYISARIKAEEIIRKKYAG